MKPLKVSDGIASKHKQLCDCYIFLGQYLQRKNSVSICYFFDCQFKVFIRLKIANELTAFNTICNILTWSVKMENRQSKFFSLCQFKIFIRLKIANKSTGLHRICNILTWSVKMENRQSKFFSLCQLGKGVH